MVKVNKLLEITREKILVIWLVFSVSISLYLYLLGKIPLGLLESLIVPTILGIPTIIFLFRTKTDFCHANKLRRESFGMGGNTAANFAYVILPFKEAYDRAVAILIRLNKLDKEGVLGGFLISGVESSGKTRLALEVLIRTLPKWHVVVYPSDQISKIEQSKDCLVIFIDRLQDNIKGEDGEKDLKTLLNSLPQYNQRIILIATCNADKLFEAQSKVSQLFSYDVETICLQEFPLGKESAEVKAIIGEFKKKSSASNPVYEEEWKGTIGSLILGFKGKHRQYNDLNDLAKTILYAMKLLTKAGITIHTEEYLRILCEKVFLEKMFLDEEKIWQKAKRILINEEFVFEKYGENNLNNVLEIRSDSYFDNVMLDYLDPGQSDYKKELTHELIELKKVLLDLHDISGLLKLALAFRGYKEYEEALKVINSIINLDHSSAYVYAIKGVLFGEIGNYKEAIKVLDKAIKLDFHYAPAYYNKGNGLYELKEYKKAIEAYDKCIELDYYHAPAYNNKGLALSGLKEYQEAIEMYEKAIELDPYHASTYYNKGNALFELKEYKKAIDADDKCIELDSRDASAYYNKGNALYELEECKKAIEAFEKAIELDPHHAPAYNNKGLALHKLKEYKKAIEAYDKAIELDPHHAPLYNNKGLALSGLKKYKKASEAYDKAIELDPYRASTYYNKGLALSDLKEYEKAIETFDKAIGFDFHLDIAFRDKGMLLLKLKRYKEAIFAFNRAIKLNPNDYTSIINRKIALEEYKDVESKFNDLTITLG